jgi:hypothetical protein
MRFFLSLIVISFLTACSGSGSGDDYVDIGYDYFPTQTGATWIYRVDSMVYDDNSGQTTIDTFVFQYKEQLIANFVDASGETAQQINRFFRYDDSLPWIPLNQSSQLKTSLNAQRVTENVRYVKLVFPLEKNKKWNGNIYNNEGTEQYTAVYVNAPTQVGNITYPQTVKVLQKNDVNAIEEIIRYEVYARNIGLVYALSDSLNTQSSGSRGYRYRFTLSSYTPQ